MDTRLNTKRILIFLAFAFGILWAAALAIYLTTMLGKSPAIRPELGMTLNYIFISTPWLANVATRLITKEGRAHLWLRPNFRRGWRMYLAVWLLPLLATVVGGVTFYLVFPQSFDPNLGEVRKLLASSPSAGALNPWTVMPTLAVQAMIVGLTINAVVSFGEEFGWRAYLLPKLMDRFGGAGRSSASPEHLAQGGLSAAGARKAALLVGVIHGVWHWPLILMVGSSSFVFLLVYLVLTCSLSVLLSWGTLRSGSMWPAAVGHGTLNSASGLAGYLLRGTANPLLGPGPTGLIGGIGYTVLALVLYFNRKAFAAEEEAGSGGVQAVAGV